MLYWRTFSPPPTNVILNCWLNQIKINIKFYKQVRNAKNPISRFLLRIKHPKLYKRLEHFGYIGNLALNKFIKKYKNNFRRIDADKIKAFPEIINKPLNLSPSKNYENFYFENDFSDEVLKNTGGMICLHNSWTPEKFKEMSEEEFLSQDCTISKVLKHILSC